MVDSLCPSRAAARPCYAGRFRLLCCVVAFALIPAASLCAEADSGSSAPAVLIDAPSALLLGSFRASVPFRSEKKLQSEEERNTACENGTLKGKPCKVQWLRVLGSSMMFISAQHGGNIWMDTDTRYDLTHGSFWGDYAYCVEHYRWSRWRDDDPFGVDYIGHPMMGGVTSAIYEQNDPKQRALTFENTPRYWHGRLRAMAYSAAYSAQWKVGPLSEASIGNTGIGYYIRPRDHIWTNETGMQDFFVTPVGGFAWNVGEDLIDKYMFSRVARAHPKNFWILFPAAFMTPTRAAANIARFRAVYYRDEDDTHFLRAQALAWEPRGLGSQIAGAR